MRLNVFFSHTIEYAGYDYDVLQTLMLAKITPRQLKNTASPYSGLATPDVDANPLCSNVYSIGERIILAWLNQHYEQMRTTVWTAPNVKGTVLCGLNLMLKVLCCVD